MKRIDVYISGVGGQGIGLLSELLIRAADYAGLAAAGTDTHGLAQRGGIVASHLRVGTGLRSPLIPAGGAGLAIALERTEALRALGSMLAPGGTLLFYDAAWQPLPVRLGTEAAVGPGEVERAAAAKGCPCHRVFVEGLEDARTQNIALAAALARLGLIEGVGRAECERALADLLDGPLLDRNLALFRQFA